jgi:RNA polymerase sigma-70 factor (ECF subfamily)
MVSSGQTAESSRVSATVKAACDRLHLAAQAARYGLDAVGFRGILLDIAAQYLPGAADHELIRFLDTLKVEELALARGCVQGNDAAWEAFLARYRASLYGAAYSVAKEESIARDLADSIYAELYGLPNQSGRRTSKLQYYKGRGSLEGWLRTVIAQEFVNRYRRTKREVSLEEKVEAGAQFAAPAGDENPGPSVGRAEQAVTHALASLDGEARFMLTAYYLDGRTLAEIGRALHVHESTISRKLEKTTASLRRLVRKHLVGEGFSRRQADELIEELDVRDLNVSIGEKLRQESGPPAFYKGTEE